MYSPGIIAAIQCAAILTWFLGCQAGVTTMREPFDFLHAGVWRQLVSYLAGSLLLTGVLGVMAS
jgi:hypothetical protein